MSQSNFDKLSQSLMKMLGIKPPVPLLRSQQAYSDKPFKDKSACVVSDSAQAGTDLKQVLIEAGATLYEFDNLPADPKLNILILILDARSWQTLDQLSYLYEVFHSVSAKISVNGRVLILFNQTTVDSTISQTAIIQGIEGFMRSLAKELGPKGISVNGIQTRSFDLTLLETAIRFLCGPESAYVSGQVLCLAEQYQEVTTQGFTQVLHKKYALVTGASRGIGLATAKRLAQEGATVIGVDVPASQSILEARCAEFSGIAYPLDISDQLAVDQFFMDVKNNWGKLDVVVHNAGITRDKSLRNMSRQQWDAVLNVNLQAAVNIDNGLLAQDLLSAHARIVCLSSMSGIAGNFGQTNYATSKAALIGYVRARAAALATTGITINAVAPGFIDTEMTQKMPWLTRTIAQRMNSLKQAGLPEDVAQAILFFCLPGTFALSGNTLRVCGQNILGA